MNIQKRKNDHLRIVSDDACDLSTVYSQFDKLKLNYKSLPEVDLGKVDTSCEFLGRTLSFPLYVSPMTGGSIDAKSVNEILAVAANQMGVGMGLGSMRAMLEDESLVDTFDVKSLVPDVPLIGNIGLVQMNYGVSVYDLNRLIDRLKLDALSVHLNPLQEALQLEGDTNFEGLASMLMKLVDGVNVPIIVKDVGTGISSDVMTMLVDIGVQFVDVSGKGGTSWAYIEGERSNSELAAPFVKEGFNTTDLLEHHVVEYPEVSLIAGGGIRSGVDLFKSIALGAVVGNVGRPFALAAQNSLEDVIRVLELFRKQYAISMFVTGVDNYERTVGNKTLLIKENV
jgi:isopentenyl-diphosphate delta-isomerase